jgi:hypothetical protein
MEKTDENYVNFLEKTVTDLAQDPQKAIKGLEDRLLCLTEELISIRKVLKRVKKSQTGEEKTSASEETVDKIENEPS